MYINVFTMQTIISLDDFGQKDDKITIVAKLMFLLV